MAKPLEGIRVLDMGTFITGPQAGSLLADLGAEVIKVEMPEVGDPFRAFKGGLYSPHYQTYNRNKKSIELNTKQPEDLAAFDELVKGADVFIQNFRPGVAERLGVDAKRLQAINPRLVYALITGFGSDGPHRDRPAFDTVAQASSGFLRLLVNPEHPRVVGPALADALTGFYAAHGVVAALYEREKTGKGRLVETSMFEAMCHFNLDDFTHLLSMGEVMGPYSRPHVSQSYVFECADGGWLALHMSSPPKFWENLAVAAGQPDMLQRPEFADRNARIANYDKVIAFLAPIFKRQPRSYWAERLAELEVPHSPVFTSQEVVDGELAQHHEIVLETEGPHGTFRTIRSPLRFDGQKQEEVVAPPVLGQHNEEILGRKGSDKPG
ncbi:carnitine dehydratase [Erythrobacter sp. SG61-1L]|uniref:CaiB/BaiF CoA transferase family protein n=1 Tax=Erythrobacter sp. SG61-1L TaxID=1603897 RepID=UPI0006C936B3|nr:CaiB/BaiF CoA-transferase family protein [Erythrobacter sp. SG61-1L]KPL69185.1 carnitine dehydratase [Erythrobacter sp. SG61-1L]